MDWKIEYWRFSLIFITGRHEECLSVPSSPQLRGRSRTRSRPPLQYQFQVSGSPLPSPTTHRQKDAFYRSTSLESRSRSPSPHMTPSLSAHQEYYGSANLTDRSRSPSPIPTPPRRPARKLPPVPSKPSTLNFAQAKSKDNLPRVLPSPTVPQPSKSPGNINFPKLSASPTHIPRINRPPQHIPPPGRLSRPEPYSPTEKNNLNKISAGPSPRTLPSSPRRTTSRDRSDDDRYHSSAPIRPAESRNIDGGRGRYQPNPYEDIGPSNQRGRSLPNGVKSSKTIRTDSKEPLHRDSDDDEDEDWC